MNRREWQVVAVAGAYAVSGWLGLQLAIPPGYATAIFPAAGIALSCLLVLGRDRWPGVLLGSALLNCAVAALGPGLTPMTVLVAVLIGAGATLQALTATWLVERWASQFIWLDAVPAILRFVLLGGPVACLVAGGIGPLVLLAAGIIPADALWGSMATWWIGDTLGVIVAAPLALLVLMRHEPIWRERVRPLLVTSGLAVGVVVTLFVWVSRWEQAGVQSAFEDRGEDVWRPVEERVQLSLLAVESLRNHIANMDSVNRTSFRRFASGLLEHFPSVQALEWIPRVTEGGRASLEAAGRAEGLSDFTIFELGEGGSRARVSARAEYFPVLYVQPEERNRKAIGFDLASNPVRQATLQAARDSNRTTATPRIDLIQDGGRHAGVLVFSPVTAGSPAHLRGFALGVFRISQLVDEALKGGPHPDIALTLHDVSDPANPLSLHSQGEAAPHTGLRHERHLNVAGRTWRLTMMPTARFMAEARSYRAWSILALGFVLVALLQAYMLEASGRALRVKNTVRDRTRDLELENRRRLKAEAEAAEGRLRLQAVIDTVVDGIITIDERGFILHANPAASSIFGYPLDEMAGNNVSMLMPEPYHSAHDGYLARYMAEGGPRIIGIGREVTGRRKDGETFPMELAVAEARLDGRRMFTGVVRDITVRKRAETDLRLAASVFHDTMEGVVIAGGDGSIISVNPAFSAITGYGADEVIGRNPRILKSDRHDEAFYQRLWSELKEKGRFESEMWNRRKDGEAFLIWQSISMIRGEDGEPSRFVAVFRDVTEMRRDDERIRKIAFHDALTGLPNRLLLNDRLSHALKVSERSMSPLAVLFLDLDGFKAVNDTLGHDVGDEVLRIVATRLREVVRSTDTVSRLGGDEFVVVLETPSGVEEICDIAERIIAAINIPMEFKGRPARVGTSIGIAVFPQAGRTAEMLMRHADESMYQAKRGGKNAYRLFSPAEIPEETPCT